jgi:hypothetical protein
MFCCGNFVRVFTPYIFVVIEMTHGFVCCRYVIIYMVIVLVSLRLTFLLVLK